MALSHAILASLIHCPASGYELAKKFDNSVGFFWHATHQQIYRELTRMEERGWLSTETIHQEGRPDKKIYSVTTSGETEMRQWIAQPSEVNPTKEDILVKLYAGQIVEPEVLLAEVRRYQQEHTQQLQVYQQIESSYFAQPANLDWHDQLVYLTLRCGIRQEESWIAWCEEAIAHLEHRLPLDSPTSS